MTGDEDRWVRTAHAAQALHDEAVRLLRRGERAEALEAIRRALPLMEEWAGQDLSGHSASLRSAAHLARDQFARQDWPGEYQTQMRQAVASVLPKLLWDSRPPGELALEVQQHNEHVARQSLRQALQGLGRDWPWQGQVALTGLLTDHDEGMLAERVQAVCEGLFTPRRDIADELVLAMIEQAQSLQVFGRPGVHLPA